MKLGRVTLFITAVLALVLTASRGEEPKGKPALPTTPTELMQWLPGTMWEMHSGQQHQAGEGYILFREDGMILQIDINGHPIETKVWAVNPKMLVVWGAINLRVMSFEKDFSAFTDTKYQTTGKRVDSDEVREMFRKAKSTKPRVGKDPDPG